ncbi:MAG: LysR family transcriptional regulator [Betaproteobacteria bacterium HGW-Betaproteobacteria-12]|nr:MAG: LysR family transcriptional regulator [Betaproteobacteria bacterium HGW-Betaproteobacteria-12]
MSEIATSSVKPPGGIRWSWDFGPAFSPADSACLLDLLRALRDLGTLGKAAAASGISYRNAWGLLRRCEETFGTSPVLKERGRGTQLSAFGEKLLALDLAARATLAETHAPWAQRLQEVLFPEQASAPERLRLAASHDLALADWIEHGRRISVDLFWRGSEEALAALVRGDCEIAGFHLPDAWPAEQATAWLGRWLKPRQYVCLPVMRRQHGLLTAPGNPLGIASLADVARLGLRLVNRQRGSGTRSMIDQLLAANRLDGRDIPGYAHEEFTHDAVAATIAGGHADVGFGIEAAAARYDLGFVPLLRDRYCLALPAGLAHSAAVAHLIRRFRGNTFRERLRAMAGYEMLDGDEPLPWERLAGG